LSQTLGLILKRVLDIFISIFALIFLTPIIVLITFLIWIESGLPVLFIQDRVGKNGEIFSCLKFRTMIQGSGESGLGIMVAENDSRITRVGRFLRRWSMDEIPQLINVLRGEMSIIGPRPVLPFQAEEYSDHERRRLEMPPGMAGYAWIHGRRSLPWSERIELDIWYIEHWSLRLDIKIFLKAVKAIFLKEGMNVTPEQRITGNEE
jgi:lipopolysaccharide/colanic/teichoic acid biosynthesis glycosyltransferase